ncbi:hypothetical protein EV421DRAFT_1892406 [Armillaria borealis]|uniref:GINS subunit domain-containing protein n=1 Tax=Armillaria borealis TaxID=47425 RepID=A0AA39MJX1_9AGAR|nr:hypothetical protein EV421DRAFT_1892406 [Armillaria borealis]
MNERHAPSILAAQEQLPGLLLDHIRRQVHSLHIRIMLVQTEVERVFIVRSYIRTRLYKIEKYARFITADAEIQTRLTTAEKAYASSLPPAQAHLDDQPVFVPPMVTQPKSRAVFAYELKKCPPVRLPDGTTLALEKD